MGDMNMANAIATKLEQLTLGEPQVFQNLAVFPLVSIAEAEPGYLTLDEALKAGGARVTEVSEGGRVPELLFDNPTPHRILLLDGDELVGAKQNRVLNITILVGPSRKLTIPVSCVEHGRWHSRSAEFHSEDRMMFARGRAAKMAQVSRSMRTEGSRMSDQGAVWREVALKTELFQAASPTQAMSDVYAHVASDIRGFRAAFHAQPRQVGGVFAIDGRAVGLELFDAPRTLGGALGRLVESYALDAIEHPRRASPVPDRATARAFLARAAGAKAEVAKALGEGEDVRLEAAGLVGEALVVDGRVVHLSVLEVPALGGEVESASSRARRVARRRTPR